MIGKIELKRTQLLPSQIFFRVSLSENSQQWYSVRETACVDEMLIAFRGRCRFRMYMPNKPAKYGIKVMAMTDARTQFLYNVYIYSGRDCYGQGLSPSEKKAEQANTLGPQTKETY